MTTNTNLPAYKYLRAESISQTAVARRASVSQATVNNFLMQRRQPTAVAKFKSAVEVVAVPFGLRPMVFDRHALTELSGAARGFGDRTLDHSADATHKQVSVTPVARAGNRRVIRLTMDGHCSFIESALAPCLSVRLLERHWAKSLDSSG
jgi:hypothetical protein